MWVYESDYSDSEPVDPSVRRINSAYLHRNDALTGDWTRLSPNYQFRTVL